MTDQKPLYLAATPDDTDTDARLDVNVLAADPE